MHKIYIEKRCIVICPPYDQALTDPNAVQFCLGDDFGIGKLISMFETSGSLGKVCIPADNPEDIYRKICAEFKEVDAAGGLVRNRRGDFLMIKRSGLWDLPKGHHEDGEDMRTTALREVQEETGVNDLTVKDLICITDHCYKRDGIWHLKHTYWYDMLYDAPTDLIPQTEEDISKAAWVAKSTLSDFLLDTYPSILEVFKEAKIN